MPVIVELVQLTGKTGGKRYEGSQAVEENIGTNHILSFSSPLRSTRDDDEVSHQRRWRSGLLDSEQSVQRRLSKLGNQNKCWLVLWAILSHGPVSTAKTSTSILEK